MWYSARRSMAPSGAVAVARNDDRWLDDLLSRTPKDVEAATAARAAGTAALPIIRRTLQDPRRPAHRRRRLATAILGARAVNPDVAGAAGAGPGRALALSFWDPAVPTLRERSKPTTPSSGGRHCDPSASSAARVDRSADRRAATTRFASGIRRCKWPSPTGIVRDSPRRKWRMIKALGWSAGTPAAAERSPPTTAGWAGHSALNKA